MARLPDRLARLRAEDPLGFRVRSVLGLVLLVLVLRLAFGDNPWQDGLAERAAEGKEPRPIDYWVSYGWWAMCLAAVAAGGLLATVARWLPGEVRECRSIVRPRPARGITIALLVVVVAGGVLASPRLTHSLWQDEDHSVRAYIAGAYLADERGELRFWGTKWRDAFLYDWGPNNSIVYSLAARTLDQLWKAVVRPRDQRPSEIVVRLPAFLFGLLSIAASAWLGLWLGFPWAGVAAGLILALHPWHLRFASEVRGYSLVMLLTALGPLLLLRALRLGSWGRWCAYGAAQGVLLWTYPSALYPVALLNLAALPMLWSLSGSPGELRTRWLRFALVNAVGGVLWLVLMAGNIAIMSEYLEGKTPRSLGASWLRDLGSQLLSGAGWSYGYPLGDPVYPVLARLAEETPIVFWAVVGGTGVLLALGVVRLWRSHRFGPWWVAVFLLPAPLGWAVAALREDFLYTRNLIFALPMLALLVGIGLDAVRAPRLRAPAAAVAGWLLVVGWLVGFVWLSNPARIALRERSFQPYRESVALTRPTLDLFAPEQKEVLTVSFSGEPFYYDPFVHMIDEAAELTALMERSRDEGRPLYVNVGRLELARRRTPEITALVEGSGRFEEVAVLHGFAPKFTQYVFRFTGTAR